MSKLMIRSRGLGSQFELNVLEFSAPIVAQISPAQTRTMMQYFPIKVNQSTIELSVIFSNEKEFERFQQFVRASQVTALTNGQYPGVVLNWPERDIRNWSGVIKNFRAGGARRNYAPRAKFVVDLIESSLAKRTEISSIAADWTTIFGGLDQELDLPALAESLLGAVGTVLGNLTTGTQSPFAGNITNGNLGIPG